MIQGLTDSGFYTSNTIFHRVVPGFVIQGGDPETNGMGGAVFHFDDEYYPKALFTGNGQLAMANSGKDTDSSQFFVTLGPQRSLDFGYTLFGQLLRGFNVLTTIGNVATNGSSRPLADVIITRTAMVADTTDTVLTLTATNIAGISGTISVVADDGAGGRTTATFTANTVTNTFNDPPFLYPDTVTNLVAPLNGQLTNTVTEFDLDGDPGYWFIGFPDQNATNTVTTVTNGQLQVVVVPNTNYVGPTSVRFTVSSSSIWNYFPTLYPYDRQIYTFAFGDTVISAQGTNFAGLPLSSLQRPGPGNIHQRRSEQPHGQLHRIHQLGRQRHQQRGDCDQCRRLERGPRIPHLHERGGLPDFLIQSAMGRARPSLHRKRRASGYRQPGIRSSPIRRDFP